jgi:hypothetical protein
MEKTCLECGRTLSGRVDKKFCNDFCRSTYNNKALHRQRAMIREINQYLYKNRRILAALNKNGKTRVHRDQLIKEGFLWEYTTHRFQNKSGDTYHFCYDQGYLPLDSDYFLLVKKRA